MAQPQGSPANGIALRAADGSLYFIRDEVMEACRVTEKDMADALNQLMQGQGDVSGFSTTDDALEDSVRISGGSGRPAPGGADVRSSSTVMCPW
jgi:spore germination protein GerM